MAGPPLPPVALAVAAVLLGACASAAPPGEPDGPGEEAEMARPSGDERFRIDETVDVALPTGRRFTAEVARDPEEQSRGLMFRSTLGEDEAMIFVYPAPKPLSIWMFNVRFPIDVLFLRDTGDGRRLRVVDLHEGVPPCPRQPCPSYVATEPTEFFLELPAWTVSSEGLVVGDVVTVARDLRE